MLHNQPKKRRCSYCRYIGHTRRQCLVLRAHLPEKLEDKIENQIEPGVPVGLLVDPACKVVPVRTFGDHLESPHIIDLQEKQVDHWDKVEVYQVEGAPSVPELETIHFGHLVAAAVEKYEDKISISAKISNNILQLIKKIKNSWFISKVLLRFFAIFSTLAHSVYNINLVATYHHLVTNIKHRLHVKRLSPLILAALIVVSLPFPAFGYYQRIKDDTNIVISESTNGFLALQSSTVAAFRANLPQAESDLANALQSFSTAENLLNNEHKFLTSILEVLPVVGSQMTSRAAILEAGQHLALGNTYLMKGVERASGEPDMVLTDRIGLVRDHIKSALPQYRAALEKFASVDTKSIPVQYQESFVRFRVLFAAIVDDLSNMVELSNAIQIAFGDDSFKRYLVVFQNNHELRPTGGFMGSYAVIDVQKGKILKVEIPPGGTYDLQGQLDVFEKPPLPLQLVNSRFEFQDANWYPDFSVSAQKIEWFYSHGRHSSVDGVIAVNASVLERLLSVLGPIDQEKYNVLLTSDTALSSIEDVVQNGSDKNKNKPKAILSDIFENMVELTRSVKPIDALRLLTELHDAMNQKEVQMYFNDQSVQNIFQRYGWTGEIITSSEGHDYLAVSVANLQGEKSDAVMDQTIEHQSVVSEDGSILDTVVIRREHHGANVSMYNAPNMTYLRVYVPEGAELLDAGGFTYPPDSAFHVPESWYTEDANIVEQEKNASTDKKSGTHITKEFGKTVFGNWVLTLPGEKSDVYFTYRLPFKLDMNAKYARPASVWQDSIFGGDTRKFSSYNINIQKQSGTSPKFKSKIIYPPGWKPIWTSDDQMVAANNGVVVDSMLSMDSSVGVIMQHE